MLYENENLEKNKHVAWIQITCALPIKIICKPPKSRETVPLILQLKSSIIDRIKYNEKDTIIPLCKFFFPFLNDTYIIKYQKQLVKTIVQMLFQLSRIFWYIQKFACLPSDEDVDAESEPLLLELEQLSGEEPLAVRVIGKPEYLKSYLYKYSFTS